jgi:biotin carboxyl carrier protein
MQLTLTINGEAVSVDVLERRAGALRFMLEGTTYHFTGARDARGRLVLDQEIAPGVWRRVRGAVWRQKQSQHVQLGNADFVVRAQGTDAATGGQDMPLSPVTPMPGLVRQLLVKKGDTVSAGQTVAVLEAMKLQLALAAGGDAVVAEVLVKEGQMVAEGVELVRLSAKP